MKSNLKRTPILVSGSHRSGSTWLGKMIGLSDDVGYIHEPFHKKYGISGELFSKWFIYVSEENEDLYKAALNEYLRFKYPLIHKIRNADSLRDYGRAFRDSALFTLNRWTGKRPLMKDPISIFSAEWLYNTFDMDVIILIRHPAAFVGSIKKSGWRTGMHNFLNQPLLIQDHLKSYEKELKDHAADRKDLIEEGILIWNMIHSVILKYKNTQDDWLFVRHEDVSRKPLQKFEEIYQYLNLEYSDTIKQKIARYTTEKDSPDKLKRNSKSNVWSWKSRLNEEEIERVRKGTQTIASHFYTDKDW